MQILRAPRILLAAVCVAAGLAGGLVAAERSSASMATAATSLLSSLSPEQRQKATFAFESDERTHWHFIPTETFPRKGLTLKEMNEAAAGARPRAAEGRLEPARLPDRDVRSWTSKRCSEQIEQRNAAERQRRRERWCAIPRGTSSPIFGTPSSKATWGWRVEGHHVSLHFTVVNGTLVATSPSFFGSNPAEVREGPKEGPADPRRATRTRPARC